MQVGNIVVLRKKSLPTVLRMKHGQTHSPQALLDTLVFDIRMYFALHGGEDHLQLRHHPLQLILVQSAFVMHYSSFCIYEIAHVLSLSMNFRVCLCFFVFYA